MSDPLLRQYETWECLGDGYPQAWHRSTPYGSYPADHPLSNPAIKDLIRDLAGHRCLRCGHPYRSGDPAISERGEWSPCDERCTHADPVRWRQIGSEEWFFETRLEQFGETGASARMDEGPHGQIERYEVEAQWRILTVHHLDEDKANCRWWNLAALCQRCHLRMQRAVVMDRVYHFEHSEWFKPYAAGFYAFKYLDEDLSREETMARLDELLALEHRFTQEALL